MGDHFQAGVAGLELGQDGVTVVGTAVVDDDDFVVVGELAERHVRYDDHGGDSAAVVIGREESRHAGWHGSIFPWWPSAHRQRGGAALRRTVSKRRSNRQEHSARFRARYALFIGKRKWPCCVVVEFTGAGTGVLAVLEWRSPLESQVGGTMAVA